MAIQERELLEVSEQIVPIRMTLKQFLAWDGGGYADLASHAEWVNGEVTLMTASDRHQALILFFAAILGTWVQEHLLGIVTGEPYGMKMAQTPAVREPDVFFIANASRSRMMTNYLDGPADLVIEVVSKESRTRDKVEKRAEYERHGVPEYWIIDYLRSEAIFLQLDAQGQYQEVAPDAAGVYQCRALPGLWLQVGWLWQNPLPTYFDVYRAWGLI